MSRIWLILLVCAGPPALMYFAGMHLDFETTGLLSLILAVLAVYALGRLTGCVSADGRPTRWLPVLLITACVAITLSWAESLGRSAAE